MLTGIERRSVRDELANVLERAFLQWHDDDRLAGGAETEVGEALDELLHDRRAQPGVGDEIRPVGALDDERRAAVEAIRCGVTDPQPSQLLVAEPALDRSLARAATTAVQKQRASAERQTADEGLPVRLSPLDRVRRHSDSTVGLFPMSGIRGGHKRRCGLPADRAQGVSRAAASAVPARAKMTRTLRPS